MTSPGQRLYEKYRRHEIDAEHWSYLDQEVRDFWESLARSLG